MANQKELIKTTFRGRKVDRPLFIPFIGDYYTRVNQTSLKEMYEDPSLFYQSIRDTQQLLNLDAVVSPIDVTIEAEAFGAEIDWGDGNNPSIKTTDKVLIDKEPEEWLQQKRISVVLEAISRFTQIEGKDIPIFASLTGPITLANYLFADKAQEKRAEITPFLIALAKEYANAGVDGIVIEESYLQESDIDQINDVLKPLINVIKHFNIYSIVRIPNENILDLTRLRPNGLIGSIDYEQIKVRRSSVGVPLTLENLMNPSSSLTIIDGFKNNFDNRTFLTTNEPVNQEDINLTSLQSGIEAIRNLTY